MSENEPDEQRIALLSKLFDLRTFIGALFIIFGVIVTLEGATATEAEIAKAGDMNISLWSGLVMLAMGVGFVAWMLIRPPEPPGEKQDLSRAPGD